MKFHLIGVVIAIMIATSASAQHIEFGVKGGLNIYDIHNSSDFNTDPKVGIHLGVLFHIHIADHFAMQPEIVYSFQGAQYVTNSNNTTLKMDYVNLPFLFQYMFDNGFRLQGGPQVSFLARAKSETGNTSTDVKNDFRGVEFGGTIGASYLFSSTGFGVDARYNFGLTDVNENGDVHSYNRGFQLGVFYQFKHKH